MTNKNDTYVWFDLEMLSFYSLIGLQDDSAHIGSFQIKRKELPEISVKAICDYIISHKDNYFSSDITELSLYDIFRGITCTHLGFKFVHKSNNGTNKNVGAVMFISNIRVQ